jgi:hypothetical protein
MSVSDRLQNHHRAYATWNGWRWAGWYVRRRRWSAALRQLWSAYVLGKDGEACQLCGRDYLLWHADDDLYGLVTRRWPRPGGECGGGLFCLACFDRLADEQGLDLKWRPEILRDRSPRKLDRP